MDLDPQDPDVLQVYEAENNWAMTEGKYNEHLSKKDAQRIADKICRKFNKPKVEVILTSATAFRSAYLRIDQRITLSRGWGQQVHVLLHELAHHVSRCEGHDQDFRDTMIKVVGAYWGRRDADSLRAEYRKQHLSVTDRRRGRP